MVVKAQYAALGLCGGEFLQPWTRTVFFQAETETTTYTEKDKPRTVDAQKKAVRFIEPLLGLPGALE
jgi:hypothetical protein